MNREYYMDNLRATLVLSGILLHSTIFLIPFSLFQQWPIRNPITGKVFYFLMLFIHVWYMPLFYFLAGYFSYRIFSKRTYWGFIKHRLFRIALPFFISFFLLSLYNTGSFIAHYKGGMQLNWSNVYAYFSFIGPLWFLYYLLFFYAITLICHVVYKKIFKEFVCNYPWLIILLFFIFDFLILLLHPNPLMTPPFNLSIDLATFCVYLNFFLFGWIYSTDKNNVEILSRIGWLMLLIGFLIVFPSFIWFSQKQRLLQSDLALKYLMMFSYLLSAWVITLGMLGVYYRWMTGYSQILRYVADASYWLYLIQVPIVLILQTYFTFFYLPLIFKLLYVYLISVIIMGLSYALFVRKTFIGIMLNGERK